MSTRNDEVPGEIVGRRTMLRGVVAGGAAVAGGALLAGCGSDDEGTSADPTSEASPQQSESTDPGSGNNNGGNSNTELVATTEVPEGGGVILAKEQVVVTQPTAGEFACFSSICTHQGCEVGDVDGGTINCPCHGSQFSIEDGSVVTGPAAAPLPAVNVTVDGDSVVRA